MVGRTHVLLNGDRQYCRQEECNLGNLITDAFVWHSISFPTDDEWNDIAIAIISSGGIRSSVAQGTKKSCKILIKPMIEERKYLS